MNTTQIASELAPTIVAGLSAGLSWHQALTSAVQKFDGTDKIESDSQLMVSFLRNNKKARDVRKALIALMAV